MDGNHTRQEKVNKYNTIADKQQELDKEIQQQQEILTKLRSMKRENDRELETLNALKSTIETQRVQQQLDSIVDEIQKGSIADALSRNFD